MPENACYKVWDIKNETAVASRDVRFNEEEIQQETQMEDQDSTEETKSNEKGIPMNLFESDSSSEIPEAKLQGVPNDEFERGTDDEKLPESESSEIEGEQTESSDSIYKSSSTTPSPSPPPTRR